MYDVAVIGGGIAGCMAALGAARCGADVILIERYGFLGGTLTACGTGPMMTFHAGNIQVVQGITGELIKRLEKKGLSTGHIFDTTGYTYSVTPFSAEGMKCELEEMMKEANVTLLYHSTVCDVKYYDREIKSVEVCGKSGKHLIEAKMFVDASGDCDLSFLAGLSYTKGRKNDGKCQPMTMNFKLINVDAEKVKEYIMSNNDEFPRLKGNLSKVTKSCRLSIGGYVKTLKEAQKDGRISFCREDILFFETNTEGEFIVNTTRVIEADPTKPEDLTKAEIEGRKQAWEVYNLLRKSVRGFENAELEFTGPFIGIRSSRQIKGIYTITAYDIVNCIKFEDTIACGGYPIDIHAPEGYSGSMYDKTKFSLKYGDIYTIPYRALISGEADNLLTAGRCISAEFEAQAAIRVSPNAGAIGHAAGTAAGICANSKVTVHELNYKLLKDTLLKQGAYLG
ncbi:MAG: FAD-dependent oxidoreductase [Clostridia bacterium]|nr:FAD-dependent oxidoreductase [Clostridia bacterium]